VIYLLTLVLKQRNEIIHKTVVKHYTKTLNRKTALLIIILSIIGIFTFKYISHTEYEMTEYEKELTEYFNEIALESEFDNSSENVIKWTKPMKLYILKDKEYEQQVSFIKNTVETINEITQDDFKIELMSDLKESNSVIFLCEREKAIELDSALFEGISEDFSGLSLAEFNNRFEIYSSRIFIDVTEPIELQKSVILEEITQSLGLLNDSEKYTNSIFYEKQYIDNNSNYEYSKEDIEIIKLLYHPYMKPGLTKVEAENILKRIFKNKK